MVGWGRQTGGGGGLRRAERRGSARAAGRGWRRWAVGPAVEVGAPIRKMKRQWARGGRKRQERKKAKRKKGSVVAGPPGHTCLDRVCGATDQVDQVDA
jgi:hypothetical protein